MHIQKKLALFFRMELQMYELKSKSQKLIPQKLKILFFLLLVTHFGHTQEYESYLKSADSLYQQQKYTESFKFYKIMFEQAEMATPAMLIKMAFINEALENYEQTLYYLHHYFLMTNDRSVLSKIKNLAEEQGIQGYEYSEAELLIVWLNHYRSLIIYSLLGLVLAGMLVVVKFNWYPKVYGVFSVAVSFMLFTWLNTNLLNDMAIIEENNTLIMNAPSAGGRVLNVSRSGHKVEVLDTEDAWTRIQWQGKTAYVKNNKLRPFKPV